jgi:hypothetical protein
MFPGVCVTVSALQLQPHHSNNRRTQNQPNPPTQESDVISTFAPLVAGSEGPADGGGVSAACSSQAIQLSTCLFDGSLLVKSGCCSAKCAELLKGVCGLAR